MMTTGRHFSFQVSLAASVHYSLFQNSLCRPLQYILPFQVPVASWFDDMQDTELLDLVPFFEGLAKVDNVYTVLKNANT